MGIFMEKAFEPEPTSGFLKPADFVNSNEFTEFTSIPSRGAFLLTRAKRQGRWWVLKGLKEEYREDSVYRALLQKEYEITSQLQHSMVVFAFSLEEVEGFGLCIVMEWIDGLTLKEWLAEGGHTRKERRHVADMLLEALAYVHSRQTQHRDLKPSNIMLTHKGQNLKLIDFGLSDTDSHAILKAPAGTEGYMAPEGPSDIYSLGCILRELCTGWSSRMVIRKCCAPPSRRYTDIAIVQRDLHRCWQWPQRILLIVGLTILMAGLYLWNNPQTVNDLLKVLRKENKDKTNIPKQIVVDQPNAIIDFADPKVKAICVAHWDTNGDGELNRGEAAAVTSLGNVFKDNTQITSFDELQYFIGLTIIGENDFYGCRCLTSVTIPNSVTSIEEWAFAGCMILKSIVIPANVNNMGNSFHAFHACVYMDQIIVDPENPVYDSRNGCNAIIETATNKLIAGCKNTQIPDGIETIGECAFEGRWTMKKMAIPESVTTIGFCAFNLCSGLTSITLPASVNSIEWGAFDNCNNLTTVRCNMETPPPITEDAFTNRANAILWVPKGSRQRYENADYWKEFKEINEF